MTADVDRGWCHTHWAEYYEAVARRTAPDGSAAIVPTRGSLRASGLKLNYFEWARPGLEGPTVVLLHGGGLSAHTWDGVCTILSSEYRCIAVDQRGHGDSDWAADRDYSISAYESDIRRVLEQVPRPVMLVGMSMGAVNALSYVTRSPDSVDALVLVDIGPNLVRSGSRKISDFLVDSEMFDSVEDFVAKAMRFNSRRDPQMLRASAWNTLRVLEDGRLVRKGDPETRRPRDGYRRAEARAAVWDRASAIACPTLLVRGADSDVTDPDDVRHAAAELGWTAVEIPGAGHTVQGDQPAALASALSKFAAATFAGAAGGAGLLARRPECDAN